MKKIIVLFVSIIVLIGLSYFAYDLSKKSKVSDDLSLIDFAVSDTASIDKIEIYDSYLNEKFIVVRDKANKLWTDDKGECVQQSIVDVMMETFYKVTLKGYVPKGAMENMKKLLMAKHKEVKIYQNGKWTKTWYVGHATQDHYGTHMLLKTPKATSNNPVIMGMKGFYGVLEPRFTADPKMFRCTQMFSFGRNDIKSIKVINRVDPDESFELIQNLNNSTVEVTTNGLPIEGINKDNLTFYMNGFENIHFNRPNYALSEVQIDSIKSYKPDYELEIEGRKSSYHLQFYRRQEPESLPEDPQWDTDYLWGILPSGELVRMQHFVVGPLLFGKDIFVQK